MTISSTRIFQLYIVLVSLSSAAIPLGTYYLKLDWLGGIIICLLGVVLLARNRIAQTPVKYVGLFIAFLLFNGILSRITIGTEFDPDTYTTYLFQYVLAFFVFVAIVSARVNTQQATSLLHVWVIVALAVSVLAIAQKLSGQLLVDEFLFIPYYEENLISRKVVAGILAPTAWFAEASHMSSFLVVPTSYLIFNLSQRNYLRRSRLLHLLVLLPFIISLVLAYSLTAMLSIFVSILAMVLIGGRNNLNLLAAAAFACVAVLLFSNSDILSLQLARLTELLNNVLDFSPGSTYYGTTTSMSTRSIGFSEGFDAFLANPIFGHGLGQSPIPYDSGAITTLAEIGVVGAFLTYGLPLMAIARLSGISKKYGGSVSLLSLSLIVCLCGDYANSLITHNSFQLQRWLLISISFSWIFSLRESPRLTRSEGFFQNNLRRFESSTANN